MIQSTTEPCVVDEARTGTSANGQWGSVRLRPARDRDKLSQAIDYRCDPEVAKSVVKGQVVVATLGTEIVIFGRTADTRTNLIAVEAVKS